MDGIIEFEINKPEAFPDTALAVSVETDLALFRRLTKSNPAAPLSKITPIKIKLFSVEQKNEGGRDLLANIATFFHRSLGMSLTICWDGAAGSSCATVNHSKAFIVAGF